MTSPGVTGAPVDVLAVMDALRATVETNAPASMQLTPGTAKEARAAIAELIEAANWASRMRVHGDMARAKQRRLRAALARVSGGAL